MNEYLYDKLVVLNTVYNNSIQPTQNLCYTMPQNIIKTPLLSHQNQLINAMHLYKNRMIRGFIDSSQAINGKIGIIGDKIGSGKTLSILAYIASFSQLSIQQRISVELVPSSSKYFYSHNMIEIHPQRTTNLIIVPHQLFNQWKTEITKHTNLKFVPIETRRFIKGEELATTIISSSFVLTTSKCYKHIQQFANENNIHWNNIFIDEVTSIYMSPSDPQLKFQFLWFITNDWLPLLFRYTNLNKNDLLAIKDRIQIDKELDNWLNNKEPINQDNHIVSSGYFREYLPYLHNARSHLVIRNRNDFVETSMKLPSISCITTKCKPNISINSIISYLHTHYEESTFQSILDSKLIRIFQALNIQFTDFNEYLWKQPVYKHALINRKINEEECVICLEKPEHSTILKCCYNIYCGKCLLRNMLINQKCPTCRSQLQIADIHCLEELSECDIINGKTKQELCLELIETYNMNNSTNSNNKDNKSKCIIYTAFDNIYYQMHSLFLEKGIIAERFENNLFSNLKTIKNFNEGSTQVLFISNPFLIRGITLTSATHLIFFHETPFSEMSQVLIHSAQRIGREKELQIYHLNSELVL